MTAVEIGAPPVSRIRPGRGALFVASFILCWVSTNPFPSLADTRWLDTGNTSDLLNQLGYGTLGLCSALILWRELGIRRALWRPVYIVTLLWLLVTSITSYYPMLSLRRFVFAACVVAMGAVVPLMPAGRQRFCDLLASVTVAIIVLCYVGVALAPDLAVHQVTDLVEPRLAGNWRGIFYHKNIAGEMMAIFIFIGLFVIEVRSRLIGAAIVLSAAIFLYFTEAKSATGFLPLVLGLAWVSNRRWAFWLRLSVIFVILALLNILSVGSLYSDGIASITQKVFSDPTFTGRTEIWQIAVDWIPKRPILGFGYGAFWQTPEVMFQGSSEMNPGAATADHAHNAIFNLAVTTGLPGAVLAFAWALVLPLRDLNDCLKRRADPALANLFLRIWIFALVNCSFESILFARGDPMWFTMLVAMFGLRYLAVLQLNETPMSTRV